MVGHWRVLPKRLVQNQTLGCGELGRGLLCRVCDAIGGGDSCVGQGWNARDLLSMIIQLAPAGLWVGPLALGHGLRGYLGFHPRLVSFGPLALHAPWGFQGKKLRGTLRRIPRDAVLSGVSG